MVVYKTSVSHFKVKNTSLKDTDGKGKFKRMFSFLSVDKGKLFFTKLFFEISITADRVLKSTQASKFFKNFQLHFILYSDENYLFNGNSCICQYFILDVLYISTI